MKILMVNRRLSVGGAERVMTLLANGMVKKNIRVDMIVLQNMERTYSVSDKVQLIQFDFDRYNPVFKAIKRIKEMRSVIKNGNYDYVISFLHIVNFYTLIAGFGNKNIVISERNDPGTNKELSIRLGRKLLYPFAYKVVFQTETAKKFFSSAIQNKSAIIPNPINDNIPPVYNGEREKKIVAVGRFVPQKNFKMAIDAFKLLYNEYPDYKLIIYGEGSLREELEKHIKENNLEECVLLPGFQKDIIEKIKKASIYISSSDFEGISNSMLEALAMGLPSVCTDCPVGGAAMMIKNNENGILVPVGDTKALYEGMKKIIEDKEFADKLSENAVKIREEYSLENICEQWLDFLEK